VYLIVGLLVLPTAERHAVRRGGAA